jgi:hypothetical protein
VPSLCRGDAGDEMKTPEIRGILWHTTGTDKTPQQRAITQLKR